MKKVSRFILILLTVSLAFSCKKKEAEPSPLQKLIGKWKTLSGSTTVGGVSEPAQACELDNIIEFKTGDVYTVDEGATKCDPSSPQTSSGTYALSSTGTTLNINDPSTSISVAFEVLELTQTRLRIKANNVLGLGIVAEYSYEKLP